MCFGSVIYNILYEDRGEMGLSFIRGWKNSLELVIKTDHKGVVELLFL